MSPMNSGLPSYPRNTTLIEIPKIESETREFILMSLQDRSSSTET